VLFSNFAVCLPVMLPEKDTWFDGANSRTYRHPCMMSVGGKL
jgi:hypothetical protein